MTCQSRVRTATPEDYLETWRLLLMGHRENGMFKLAVDKVDWFITRMLNPSSISESDPGTRGIIGVIGPVGGTLEGLVFVIISEWWYSHDKCLEEFLVFVDPEHRKSNHAKSMIAWMKEQVEITGLPLVTGVISNERTQAKCRLYQRMMPKIGEFFFVSPKGNAMTPQLSMISS